MMDEHRGSDILSREEAIRLMDRLMSGVSGPQASWVAAQAVWGFAPWSSRTAYVRAMASWVADRFGSDLPPLSSALVLAACARASIEDRRLLDAAEEAEAALEQARRAGDPRVIRACEAVLARALLQNGVVSRGLQVRALLETRERDDPPALAPEVALAEGVGLIVQGDARAAAGAFAQVESVVEGLPRSAGSTARWHQATASAGFAHAMFRCGDPARAIEPLDLAIETAQHEDAAREAADLSVVRAACLLAIGRLDRGVSSRVTFWTSASTGLVEGVNFLIGVPADLAGCTEPREISDRLERAAAERLTVRDLRGFLLAGFAAAALDADAGWTSEALRVLDLAREALNALGDEQGLEMVERASSAVRNGG